MREMTTPLNPEYADKTIGPTSLVTNQEVALSIPPAMAAPNAAAMKKPNVTKILFNPN